MAMTPTLCPHCGRHAARCGCDMGEPDMRCTCELARREARAEAFREAAEIARRPFQPFSLGGDLIMDREQCEAIADAILRHDDTPAAQRESAGSPVRMKIVDCVEDDGFITAHVTDTDPSWPSEDGGLDG